MQAQVPSLLATRTSYQQDVFKYCQFDSLKEVTPMLEVKILYRPQWKKQIGNAGKSLKDLPSCRCLTKTQGVVRPF